MAKAAGVSHGTASNVFSRPEIVREELRERVLAAAAKLNYAGPDPRGRMLRAGKVNAIGVATAEPLAYFFEDPFARVVMSGISQVCDEVGAGISLVSAASNEQLAWNIQSALVDGFIVFCIEGGSRLVQLTRERGLPFVALDFGNDDETIASIGIDDYAGATAGGAAPRANWGTEALACWRCKQRMWRSARRATSTRPTASIPAHATASAAISMSCRRKASRRRRSRSTRPRTTGKRPRPRWLICSSGKIRRPRSCAMSDRMAIEALDWLKRRGLSVPGDVSIVGFDDVPEAATCQPSLTTIAQPGAEIGRRAARTILEFDGTLRRETLPVELIVRGSTAQPLHAAKLLIRPLTRPPLRSATPSPRGERVAERSGGRVRGRIK